MHKRWLQPVRWMSALLLSCGLLLSGAALAQTEVVMAWKADANSLDAHDTAGHQSIAIVRHIHDGLVQFDENMNIQPQLATSWETSADGRVWTFHLREGVRFHDGTPFDAEAVKFNVDRVRSEVDEYTGRPLIQRAVLNMVTDVRVIDPLTVELETAEPFGPLLASLAHMGGGSIISPTALESRREEYASNPVGTGPYIFERWLRGDRIELSKNPDYWGDPELHARRPNRIIIRAIPEDGARIAALESGEVHLITEVPLHEVSRLEGNEDINVVSRPTMMVLYFGMNHQKPPFDNLLVRRALNHAIDREAIVQALYRGQARVADSIAGQGALWYSPSMTYEYDPELARELLAEAGLPSGFRTTMLVSTGRYLLDNEFLAVTVQQFAQIGVDVTLEHVEWATHTAVLSLPAAEADHDMWLRAWSPGTGETSYTLRSVAHSAQMDGGWNWANYSNPEVDRLIAEGMSTLDVDEAGAFYAEAQRILMEDALWVPLWSPNTVVAMDADLQGVLVFPNEPVLIRDAWLDN